MSAIKLAVDKAGGQAEMARQVGVTPQAVWKWLASGKAPAERVLAIEKATGITRYDLRPDIYGDRPDSGAVA